MLERASYLYNEDLHTIKTASLNQSGPQIASVNELYSCGRNNLSMSKILTSHMKKFDKDIQTSFGYNA